MYFSSWNALSTKLQPQIPTPLLPSLLFGKFPVKTGAVAICFSKKVSFSLEKQVSDPDDRYLILVGHLGDSLVTLMYYYAPNTGQLL